MSKSQPLSQRQSSNVQMTGSLLDLLSSFPFLFLRNSL